MDRRRHVFPRLVALAAVLGLVVLGLGGPAQAISRSTGHVASASVAQDPPTSGEHPISELPALDKVNPAIASDGTTRLVVWSDYLDGTLPQIRSARVDASGAVLGEFAVSPSPAAQASPAIAYNGTNFFVVWEEGGDLFGTRVTPAGAVLDGYGIPVAISRAEGFSEPALSSNGTDFLVAWIGRTDTGDAVFAKRVTGAGAVLDGAGFDVGSAGQFGGTTAGGPAVAFNGTTYLVVWSADSCPFCGTVLGSRVSTAGAVLNPGGFPVSLDSTNQYFNEFAPSVSATGTQFVVAWTAERCTQPGDCRDFLDSDVLAGRVSASGTVLGTSNIAVTTADGFAGAVSVASTVATSLIVWSDGRSGARDIYSARVSTAGAVLDPSGVRVSTASLPDDNPTIARSGTGFVLAWESGVDIADKAVDSAGVVSAGGTKVASAGHSPSQATPDVAWDGSEVVAVWRESRTGLPDTIRVGRALPGGDPTSGEGTVIASGFDLGDPAVASSGQQQLVVWPQDEKIYGARIAFGSVIGPNPIVVSPPRPDFTFPRSPAVAWNGTNYLVAWSDDNSGNLDLFGARVDPSGTVLDPTGINVSSAPGDQDVPAIASNGADFLVAWNDTRSGSTSDVYGSRISGAGSVLNAAGLLVSAASGDQSFPAAAWNGTSYVVAWQDGRAGTSLNVYATRVSSAGGVTDASGIPISTATNDQSRPTVSVTGTGALVVWEDRRSGTGIDLYGARLTTGAVVRDPQGLVISNGSTNEFSPGSAQLTGGKIVIAYQRAATEAPYRADHVFFRVNSPK